MQSGAAPAGLARDVSTSIAKAMETVMKKENVKQRYADWGIEPCAGSQATFEKFVLEQQEIWRSKIQEVGIPAQ
ncbi:MAG: hypothetical protein EOP77_00580 [Variovorax sp.]|nr:MAG: hypothetical protein EOP77_00580 [Variovorax sp.]